MPQLFATIRKAVVNDRYLISLHADERIRERGIPLWQVLEGLEHGTVVAERLADKPHPVIEVEQVLADGTIIKSVWSWLKSEETAKLVTVHYLSR